MWISGRFGRRHGTQLRVRMRLNANVGDMSCTSAPNMSHIRFFSDQTKKKDPSELFNPYAMYEKQTGKKTTDSSRESGYKTDFDSLLGEMLEEEPWVEPEAMMKDKSWPVANNFEVLDGYYNIPEEVAEGEKRDDILKEVFRRINHQSIDDICLPEMDVTIPHDHPDKEAFEIMKLALENNGRIKMDDKNEIMMMLMDEIRGCRESTVPLFQPTPEIDFTEEDEEVDEEADEDEDPEEEMKETMKRLGIGIL